MALTRDLTRISMKGDKDACEKLKNEGMKLMGKVREQVRLSPLGLQQYKMVQKLDDGSIIEATTCYGQEQINIVTPITGGEEEFKLPEGFFPAYKVSDGWIIADQNTLKPLRYVTDYQVKECPGVPGTQHIITVPVGSPLASQYYQTGEYPLGFDFELDATYGAQIKNSDTSGVIAQGSNTDHVFERNTITGGGTGWITDWGEILRLRLYSQVMDIASPPSATLLGVKLFGTTYFC